MATFQRLTWADLETTSRADLAERMLAEQDYWARKERRGLSDADRAAHAEFRKMLHAALNPAGLADALGGTANWLEGKGRRSMYFDEAPGRGDPEA